MKSMLAKDSLREVKKSISRFLSIFIIVTLGCGFFAGVKATMPDMKETAADFFIENNLMDIKLMSNIGIRYADIRNVAELDFVEGVMASYSRDVYYSNNGENEVVKVMSYPASNNKDSEDYLNRPVLLEGRLPENSGECVVETTVSTGDVYKIGNSITLASPSENEPISNIFTTDTFKIVGIVASPLYIGYERDATNIGNGTVNNFIIIGEQDFVLDYYSELYIKLKDVNELDPFSDEYINAVDSKRPQIIAAFTQAVQNRYNSLVSDANYRVDVAESTISKLEDVLKLDVSGLKQLYSNSDGELEKLKKQYGDKPNYLQRSMITGAEEKLKMLSSLIDAREKGDTSLDEKYNKEIETAKAEIVSGKAELEDLRELSVYDFTRFSSTDYSSFAGDSEKIDSIAKVFPVFFIIVAALVCLTTMTRMVEEHRTEIGTYKALGYSSFAIASKYLSYAALASVSGSIIGVTIGFQLFPKIIYDSYKILYNIPSINTPFRVNYAIGCVLVSVACTSFAVLYACIKELKAQPSELMRPKSPPVGKRVLLERVPLIWNRLGFLSKVTVRNLFRYKKRFAMTIVGVAGCTALIMTAFGLKHSISAIVDLQFGGIFKYDAVVVLNNDEKLLNVDAGDELLKCDGVKDTLLELQSSVELKNNSHDMYTGYICVPEKPEKLDEFISLRDCKSGELLTLDDDEVIITEKISLLLNIGVGDEITVSTPEKKDVRLKVTAVAENYAMHYVFITQQRYEQIYGQSPVYNQAVVNVDDMSKKGSISTALLKNERFLGLVFLEDKGESFYSSIDSLNSIVWLLIICAAALAVVVLYNLANINITERVREIATIKVLGFYDGETSAYIYRENIISTIIGILTGWIFGIFLHRFVVLTAEVDLVMFERSMVWYGYVLSAIMTVVFAIAVNVVLHFKLMKIDMVESLKSVE